jgi:hypothetical protein
MVSFCEGGNESSSFFGGRLFLYYLSNWETYKEFFVEETCGNGSLSLGEPDLLPCVKFG